jgi:glutamate 5-kinase
MTDQDFSSAEKRQRFADTVNTLLRVGIIPIINENDVMSTRTTPLTDQVCLWSFFLAIQAKFASISHLDCSC